MDYLSIFAWHFGSKDSNLKILESDVEKMAGGNCAWLTSPIQSQQGLYSGSFNQLWVNDSFIFDFKTDDSNMKYQTE